jgi:hypothetical protein
MRNLTLNQARLIVEDRELAYLLLDGTGHETAPEIKAVDVRTELDIEDEMQTVCMFDEERSGRKPDLLRLAQPRSRS